MPMSFKFIITIFCIFFVSLPAIGNAKQLVDPEETVITKALQGQELIFARDYKGALKIFDELERDYPDSPAGPFGRMAIYEVRMLEREDFHLEREYDRAAERGRELVGRVLQRYNPGAWDQFLAGSIEGLDGFIKARKGSWWGAYVAGTKARQLFHRVKEMDRGFMDADFGLGMYLYWRSVYTQKLWFLRFFPDKRDEGIAIVERVAREGRFAKELAHVNLSIMYMEEKRFADAQKVLEHFAQRYPENVILRKLLGKVLVAQKRYDAALGHFRAMHDIDPELKKAHYFIGATLVLEGDPSTFPEAEKELKYFIKIHGGKYWPASAHYWLGRLAEMRGDRKLARREYETALELYPRLEDPLRRIRGLGGGL